MKYFFNFKKDFINPYGPAHDASYFTDQQIGARLSQMNCVFVMRLNITMSDFAHTLLTNTEYLKENILILDGKGIDKFFHKIKNYKESLRILNSENDT